MCERPQRPNCCPRDAGLDDRTTLLPAVEPLTTRPAEVGRLQPVAAGFTSRPGQSGTYRPSANIGERLRVNVVAADMAQRRNSDCDRVRDIYD